MADKKEKPWYERAWDWRTENIIEPQYKHLPEWVPKPSEAYDYLGGPSQEDLKKLSEGYDDNWTKYPKGILDALSFTGNTIKDFAQFIPDVATDTLQYLAADKGDGWFPGLSQEQKYRLDAWAPFGISKPSIYTKEQGGNPYRDPSIFKKYYKQAGDKAEKHFFTNEDKGGFMNDKKNEQIWKAVKRELPWESWALENPEGEIEDFKEMENKLWHKEFALRYGKNWDDFVEKDVDRSLMEDYGIGADKSALSDSYEFGFGGGDWKIPFTDHDVGGYAWDKKPLFPYFNKEKDIIYDAHILSDIFAGPGLTKQAVKQGRKLFSKRPVRDGIMSNRKQIEGPKFKFAEDFVNRGR